MSEESTSLKQRFETVRNRLRQAALDAGRDPSAIQLIAVSKTHPAEAIEAAFRLGQRDFGENYVQELASKAEALAHLDGLRFHLIGHLQTNKAKVVAPIVHGVQTVDSLRLVEELAARVASRRPTERGALEVMVEVNVGGEAQKSGASDGEVATLLDAIEKSRGLVLRGLMTVPPFTDNAADSLPYFEALVSLRARLGGAARLPELSMGMSHDLEYAVRAGATMVRVGTALFGSRPPKEGP